ncbi:MAG TPA: pyridoxal phosphate-dependent aminotransferase [Candidatus Acidoferrales bacterium]|nr:pyridoxal phosphate-dependent aminotransferase [Candidatus Acidoferrales bacterium]
MADTVANSLKLAERVERISVSATLAVVQEAERLRAQGVDLVDFGPGEPDFPTPEAIKQAAIRALEENFTKYTPAAGTAELRSAACAWHRRELGSDYQPQECIITVGGKHGIFNTISALVERDQPVLIPVPYWVSFPEIVRYVGGQPVFVPTEEKNGFRLTAADLERAWVEGTRVVIVNSPNNPSGAVLEPEEWARILALCRRRGAWLLSDECYSHFVYQGTPFSVASLPEAKAHLIVCASLSKTFAMTGWRLGFTLAPEPIVKAMTRLQSHSTSNPTSIAQKAAVAALTGPMDSVQEMLAEYRRRRARVLEGLRRIPKLRCTEPQGAFYVYPNLGEWMRARGVQSTTEVAERLLKEVGVVVVPGEAFGTAEHIRISYATSMERIEEGLRRLEKFFSA